MRHLCQDRVTYLWMTQDPIRSQREEKEAQIHQVQKKLIELNGALSERGVSHKTVRGRSSSSAMLSKLPVRPAINPQWQLANSECE